MEEKKILLSVKDLVVKFRVRGRVLTAIRGVSLDIYENESIAIVGESGSGKSVLTKTFSGMTDENGFIEQGTITFQDDLLSDVAIPNNDGTRAAVAEVKKALDAIAPLAFGAETEKKRIELESEKKRRATLSEEEEESYRQQLEELRFRRTEEFNRRQTLDSRREKEAYRASGAAIRQMNEQIKALEKQRGEAIRRHSAEAAGDTAWQESYRRRKAELDERYQKETARPITAEMSEQNGMLAREVVMSLDGLKPWKRRKARKKLLDALRDAMRLGVDLADGGQRRSVFETVVFHVAFVGEDEKELRGRKTWNLANMKDKNDWLKVRGTRIATIFQDPMTSLNPILTIGKQITSVIMKHQNCSEAEARNRALELMLKVGIPNAESRFDDYPFQYSGGMRQRVVIAIALSCQPKILICDEPTTALDVTIQAQILKLIKDLQKEFKFTIVFITHDLGVVANVADRVAVLYAGQIVELGTVEEVFYDPRHPYTWAMLSSLPQLAQRNTQLYSITGTPPSLYNKIVGDPFAPRNPYCLTIDTLKDPPMFRISETHFAKTWLLDPRAPRVEKPEAIQNLHEKLMAAFNI